MLHLAQHFRFRKAKNALQLILRRLRNVHAELRRARRGITRFGHHFAHLRRIPSARITKMPDPDTKSILQFLFAADDLFAQFRLGELRQVAMGQTMRANLLSSGEPFADFARVHQRLRHIAVLDIPLVARADHASDDELDRAELVAHQNLQRVLQNIPVTVIEGNDHFLFGISLRRQFLQRAGSKTVFGQLRHLFRKPRFADIQKRVARAGRRVADAMIREDRQSLTKQLELGRAQEELGRKMFEHKSSSALIGLAFGLRLHFTFDAREHRGDMAGAAGQHPFLFQNDL